MIGVARPAHIRRFERWQRAEIDHARSRSARPRRRHRSTRGRPARSHPATSLRPARSRSFGRSARSGSPRNRTLRTRGERTPPGPHSNEERTRMEAPVAVSQSAAAKNGDGERSRAVDAAILQIEKQFGRGAIMRLGDREAQNVPAVSTGSVALDLALGVGGVPRGRITEIYGPESSGKTTLCYHIASNAQRAGGIVAFIDAEHALDPGYARNVGVDVDELLMSQALRKLTGAINRSRTALVFTNQLREKIGVMFGNPETTPGGRALKFYASVRLDIRRIETLKT